MPVYKIRNAQGLFSSGGMHPQFSKKGKVWTTKSALSNHISLVRGAIYNGCVVVEYEYTEMGTSTLDAIFAAKADRKKKAEEKRKKQLADFARQRDLTELARLRALYPES